jgi:hypothetical protein
MFLQFAAKFDSRRELATEGGKIFYLTHGTGLVVSQECVMTYKSRNSPPFNHSVYAGKSYSNAGNWQSFQEISSTYNSEVDIIYGEWQTFLVQFVGGDEYDDGIGTGPKSQLRIWRQRPNETEYTMIMEGQNWADNTDKSFALDYQNSKPNKVINTLIFNHLLNSINNPEDVDLWHDEVILSHSWIPPRSTFSTSSLKTAADNLSAGQWSLEPIAGNPDNTEWDISWQNTTAYWDDMRREIQYMGKPQAPGGLYRSAHFIYSEQSDNWRTTKDPVAYGKYGHVWGKCFDDVYDIGRYYYIEQDAQSTGTGPEDVSKTLRYMDRVVEAGQGSTNTPWTTLPEAPYTVNGTNVQSSLGFHPNLFGPGNPGIVVTSKGGGGVSHHNIKEGTWTKVFGWFDPPYYGGNAVYDPINDVLICPEGSEELKGRCRVWPAGSGGTTNYTDYTNGPPIAVRGTTAAHGKSLLHPVSQKPMILEASGSERVWTTSDGGQTWDLESYTHPFWTQGIAQNWATAADNGSYTVCSIPRYGVVMALYSEPGNATGHSILWRPE